VHRVHLASSVMLYSQNSRKSKLPLLLHCLNGVIVNFAKFGVKHPSINQLCIPHFS